MQCLQQPWNHARRFTDSIISKCGRLALWAIVVAVSFYFGAISHGPGVDEIYKRASEAAMTIGATLALMWKGWTEVLSLVKQTAEAQRELKEAIREELDECKADRTDLHAKMAGQATKMEEQTTRIAEMEKTNREIQEQLARMAPRGQVQA